MKLYINFADHSFQRYQQFAKRMAMRNGNFDNAIGYSRADISREFYRKNKSILDREKGAGYWLWKPYFIDRALKEAGYGDYIFYSDAGAFFLKPVDLLIECMEKYNQDVMGFELPLIEYQWTKKELFRALECEDESIMASNHLSASFQLVKKSAYSIAFYEELLQYSCDEQNISDTYDQGLAQDPDFIDHRHDQSVFSLLYKKRGLRPFKDPTQLAQSPWVFASCDAQEMEKNVIYRFDNGRLVRVLEYEEQYDMVLFHHRRGHPTKSLYRFKLARLRDRILRATTFLGVKPS